MDGDNRRTLKKKTEYKFSSQTQTYLHKQLNQGHRIVDLHNLRVPSEQGLQEKASLLH